MNLINNLRRRAGNHALASDLTRQHRTKRNCSLTNASSIGLLYYLADEATYHIIEAFIQTLNENRKKVRLICYTEAKLIPHYFIPKLAQDVLTVKDLNWFHKPTRSFVKEFISEEFDLLIDLSLNDYFPLHYIAAMSAASLKVGRFEEDQTDHYDLMIHASPDTNLNEFISQIDHYLNMLNQKPDGQ